MDIHYFPRRVSQLLAREASEEKSVDNRLGNESQKTLESFRSAPAWVLLGEPGAGKSVALQMEATACQGIFRTVADFIAGEIDETLRGKVLFLDGLDEIRASGLGHTLHEVKHRLRQLQSPQFRLACRVADWRGESDKENLSGVLGSPPIELQLLAFTLEEKQELLSNLGVANPSAFIKRAQEAGITELLDNPQTIELLVTAVRQEGQSWPTSRKGIYELACLQMAEESNKRYRDARRTQKFCNAEETVDAAGYVMAILLLADQVGVALDRERRSSHYFLTEDISVESANANEWGISQPAIQQALGSKFFRPNGDSAERVIPAHRSVAEYLAARWLSKQLAQSRLPLSRLQSALLGRDGAVVSGLRGLYAWLADCSEQARSHLLQADVLAVITYGDISQMPLTDKRSILTLLKQIFSLNPWGYWASLHDNARRFAGLIDQQLIPELISALKTTATESDRTLGIALLYALPYAHPHPMRELRDTLYQLITDKDKFYTNGKGLALNAWLEISTVTKEMKLQLLEDIARGAINDPDDDLLGNLLSKLYPTFVDTAQVLRFLRTPKNGLNYGNYPSFWRYTFLTSVKDNKAHLLMRRLQDLIPQEGFINPNHELELLPRILNDVLPLALQQSGDDLTDAELFDWLHLGFGEWRIWSREKESQETIAAWLSAHPDRYKGLLLEWIGRCQTLNQWNTGYWTLCRVLDGVDAPPDLAVWYLQQTEHLANDPLINACLNRSLQHWWSKNEGGLIWEDYQQWAAHSPARQVMLEALSFCPFDPTDHWRLSQHKHKVEDEAKKAQRKSEQAQRKSEWTRHVMPHLASIQTGTAPVNVMYNVAMVWGGRMWESTGESPRERMSAVFENGDAVYEAAKQGLPLCPERIDLPSVDEVIALAIKSKEHPVRQACLLGMDLRYAKGHAEIDKLQEAAIQKMAAFWLIDGCHPTPQWWHYVVRTRAQEVADVYTAYVLSAFRTKTDHVTALYDLRANADHKDLAIAVVPRLLQGFPVRASKEQCTSSLAELLKVGVLLLPDSTLDICTNKLKQRSLDETQKTLWLATASLLDAKKYEKKLLTHIGTSEVRAQNILTLNGDSLRERGLKFAALDWPLLVKQKLIELLTPHAQFEHLSEGGVYVVTDAIRNARCVQGWINQIVNIGTLQAKAVLDYLQMQPHLQSKLQYLLGIAQAALAERLREGDFRFLSVQDAAALLRHQAPAHVQDLQELVLHYLQDIQKDIQGGDDNQFQQFWNEEQGACTTPRVEEWCRDVLLTRLREKLAKQHHVQISPEAQQTRSSRADLKVSYQNKCVLPIEIKRAQHSDLWSAAETQLAKKYAIDPLAQGYGIYLVLWFGRDTQYQSNPKDGGKRALTSQELQQRLTAHLSASCKPKIKVFVLNVEYRLR
ncbi:MAG: hypothetical protein QM533_12270 [Cytophagales bacterium]|nr:hypothetical protein [Cytophagales bacterium]